MFVTTLLQKVSIFWDIENCRPKMKSILEVVANIRSLVLQGRQVIKQFLFSNTKTVSF